ncbi:MAG: porin family protein [Pseudomonadales bacterium]
MSRPLASTLALAAVAGALSAAQPAAAADLGPYLGAGVGIYTLSLDDDEFDDFDDNAAFGRLFGGMRLTDHLAIEADYQKLAETKDDLLGAEVEVDASAWTLSIRPILPVTDFIDLYGRLGWTWYDVNAKASGFGSSFRVEDSGSDFTWGGGIDVNLSQSLSLRGDFSRIEIEDTDLNLISAGILFRF